MSVSAATCTRRKPSTPDWLGRLPLGRWYRISGDNPDLNLPVTAKETRYLQAGDPAMDARLNPSRGSVMKLRRLAGRYVKGPWSGHCDFRSITEAWNGAVFADHFGDSGSMIIFGDGHDDYFGSDVHAFDLATREWKRISDGYVTGGPEAYGGGAVYPEAVYPDGSPLPPHTYEYVQYDPVGNDYLLFKGQAELGPNVAPIPIPHMFNLDTLSWRRGPKHASAVLNSGGWTTWDATRRTLWGNSGNDGNAFIGFCPDGDNGDGTFGSWGPLSPNKMPGKADHNAMMIDPIRDIIVVLVHDLDALYAIDPTNPKEASVRLSSREPKPSIVPYSAVEYAPTLDAFVYYTATDGPHIFSITAPEGITWSTLTSRGWTWRDILKQGNTLDPVADAAAVSRHRVHRHHTFGRFRIAQIGYPLRSRDVNMLGWRTRHPIPKAGSTTRAP